MTDELLSFEDDGFLARSYSEPSPTIPPSIAPTPWWELYQYELYDWNDPEFLRENSGPGSYRVIPLTRGYFMIVESEDFEPMTYYPDGSTKKWYASVHYHPDGSIRSVYGRRCGREGEPEKPYAHRELVGCLNDSGDVDHVNGHGLDNRLKTNLRLTSHSENVLNCFRGRRVNLDLPRGVILCGKDEAGNQLYGWQRSIRRSRKKVDTIRSKERWLSPELAGAGYQAELKRIHDRAWAHQPETITYVTFPPLAESEPEAHSMRNKAKSFEFEIPF
jgi:hypothetical protein